MIGAAYHDRVDVQRDVAEDGAELPVWENVICSVPATIEPVGGQQAIEGDQIKARTGYRVSINYLRSLDVKPDYRLLVRSGLLASGTILNVRAVNHQRPFGADRLTVLDCEEYAV